MLFPGRLPSPRPADDAHLATVTRRPLLERVLEVLRYLAQEADSRCEGGLGEAQAAGYIAGRLRRAEQQAVVFSFRRDAPPWLWLVFVATAALLAWLMPALFPARLVLVASPVVVVIAALLFWNEHAGSALASQLVGWRMSQSVVGVRAARSPMTALTRVVVVAPLDGPPVAQNRRLMRLVWGLLVLQAVLHGVALGSQAWPWRVVIGVIALVNFALLGWLIVGQRRSASQPNVWGAGELAALVGITEEVGPLERVELWTVAAGAAMTGDASLRQFLRRYPFDHTTAVINLDCITTGTPVYTTREGSLRERRSDRTLLRLASNADAHDTRINAEPRPLYRRTLAHLPLKRGLRTLTITSHPATAGYHSPTPQTIARCVYLVVGLLHELDGESTESQAQRTELS